LTPGKANTCIDTYAQLFKDTGSALVRNGINVHASETGTTSHTWDPQLPQTPAQPNCNDDLPHPGGSCGGSFIGDYFGTAIANGNLYILNISTADNYVGVKNPNHDQIEVLQIVPLS
jgi:hypothetical protein